MQMKIALVGNSGSGKTTLFNSLTGVPQDAGNRAGITVERKEAPVADDPEVILMDLPGIVSLAPYTREEAAVRNCLVQERPDAILNVIEGTNPEPGLFLSTQLNDLGVPFVMAVGRRNAAGRFAAPLGRRITSYTPDSAAPSAADASRAGSRRGNRARSAW